MGVVYAAADQALDRDVAVKVLRDELAADARAAERFEREARLAARFSHPNVVTVHDFGLTAGRGFLVMELLTGHSLREELDRERRLDPRRVLEVLGPVCAAVQAAHHRHLVHRDLKPENIFLSTSEGIETPKVLDFGISKMSLAATTGGVPMGEEACAARDRFTVATAPGALVGTPEYMAPEQIRGEEMKMAWDVWALAIMAYEMLTGRVPVLAGFAPNVDWPPVPDEGPAGRARAFFLRALSIDPARRPGSVHEFYEGLMSSLAAGESRP